MKRSDIKPITAAAEDALAAMRAARAATLEVQEAIATGAAAEVQPAANRCDAVHTEAVMATQSFSALLLAAGVNSVRPAITLAADKVKAASTAAQQLKSNATAAVAPVPAGAPAAGAGAAAAGAAAGAGPPALAGLTAFATAGKQADDEAVQRLVDAEAAFKWSPEYDQAIASRIPEWIREFPFAEIGKWLTGGVIVVIAGILLWEIKKATSGDGTLLENLARAEYARGLITFLLSVGTIVIAVLLVVGVLLGDGKEESQRKFGLAKEVLAVLVGIFGTILGFYFGTATTGAPAAPMKLSPLVISRSADGASTTLAAAVTGGRPPYTYALVFQDNLIPTVKEQKSEDGRITQTITNAPAGKTVSFTLNITDSTTNRIIYESTAKEHITGKTN